MSKKADKQKALHKSRATKIGVGIAAARKFQGVTQEELAERIGIETETVSRFERGATMPSLVTLQKLAVELDTTTEEREPVLRHLTVFAAL